MAIDRAPWNALIDDDGSNLVGTIWNKDKIKTVILDPTDAALATIPIVTVTSGTFTPNDASGAGLVLVQGGATYTKVGRLVFIWMTVTYPATANGALASIGGLPFANGSQAGGLYTTYGIQRIYYIPTGATTLNMYNPTSIVALTNANMSGAPVVVTGFYQVAA